MTVASTTILGTARANVSVAGVYFLVDLSYHLLSIQNLIGNASGALAVPIVSLLEVALGSIGILVVIRLRGTYGQAVDLRSRLTAALSAILTAGMAAFNFLFAIAILVVLFFD